MHNIYEINKNKCILTIDKLKITFEALGGKYNFENESNYRPIINNFSYQTLLNYNLYDQVHEIFRVGIFCLRTQPKNNSPFYKFKFDVIYQDEIIGWFYTDSNKGKYVLFEFSNHMFYDWQRAILPIINNLQDSFNLRFNNVCQVDIALDSKFDVFDHLFPIIDQHKNNPYFSGIEERNQEILSLYNGRTIKSVRFDSIITNLYVSHPYTSTIYIGKKKNGKELKVYDKSLQHYDYQLRYFDNYFNIPGKVYRIEISIYHQSDKKQHINIERLDNLNYLKELFLSEVGKMLIFRDLSTSHKIKNGKVKYKQLNIIDFYDFEKMKGFRSQSEKSINFRRPSIRLHIENSNKRRYKNLIKEYFSTPIDSIQNDIKSEIINFIYTYDIRKGASIQRISNSNLEENLTFGIKIIHEVSQDFEVKDFSLVKKLLLGLESCQSA